LLSFFGTSDSLNSALLTLASYGEGNDAVATDGSKNILLIIADDIGVDNISVYAEQPNFTAQTPNIDTLASDGVLFRNTWANPKCSPSRASLLTGRHAFRHGVTHPGMQGSLDSDEETIAEAVSSVGYQTALFGKWHLGNVYPTDQGFDYFSGSLGNLESYFDWEKTQITSQGGELTSSVEAGYATQIVAEESLAWIQQTTGPWFAQVAFHAPHSPHHVPPSNRFSHVTLSGDEGDACTMNANSDDVPDCYRASAEALDSFIGDLLAGIDADVLANTLIIFVGDNGTPGEAVVEEEGLPFYAARAKGTVYEGGVNVPLIIGGGSNMGIDVTEVSDNIQIQDIFSTVLAIANTTPTNATIDGQSLIGYIDTETSQPNARAFLFTELTASGEDIDRWAVSDGETKYIYNEETEECYQLSSDPSEQQELYQASGAGVTECETLKALRPQ
jgi:arylsulfatase A-like enzyme